MHGHVGFLSSGHVRGQYGDGCAFEFTAPEVVVLEPGHDAWVVGREPAVLISSTPRERQRSASGFRPSIATERSFRSAASLPTDEEGHEATGPCGAARDRRCRSRSRASTRGHRHRHSAPGSAGSRGRTLDTIADLTTYLKKKERLLRFGPAIAAAGKEELLARRDALTCAYS